MTENIVTRILALRPRDGLHLEAASGAVHPAHGVGEQAGLGVTETTEAGDPSRGVIFALRRIEDCIGVIVEKS